jgi:hypothetical protein
MDERTSDVSIYPDPSKNAIVLRCDKLSGKFINDEFRYKSLGLLVATGHIEVDISTIMIQAGFSFG